MSVENIAAPDEKFCEELIKLFFQPQSYFYYCLQKSLKSDVSLNQQSGNLVTEIISNLLDFLIHSKNAIAELKEISNVKKFANFYADIKSEIARGHLSNLDNAAIKNFIKQLASQTFENLVQVFSLENNRLILQSYLDLKNRLSRLLNDSNGNGNTDKKKLISDYEIVGYIDGNKADIVDQTSTLAEMYITGQQEEDSAFQKFFDQEIHLILKPITDADANQKSDPSFIDKTTIIFEKLAELGNFHNNHELLIISEKVLQVLQAAKKLQFSEMKPIADLIVTANQAIDHFVFCHHNREQLNRFLWRFDEFLAKLGVSSQQNQENEIDGEMTERDFKFINLDNSASAKSNLANETPSPLQQTGANGKDTEFISSDVNSKNKTMNFSLPGEEDEDLMNLIQEISSSMAITSHKKENQINFNAAISAETEEAVRDHKKYSYKTFCEEGDLFIQVILKAIEQLNENQNESAPLEDIELAGSSLKMLAKKCSFDKIAFLPELIESICINVKKTTNLLPQLIREKIKDGALFLKDFDPTNKDHESKLMTILSVLRKYYAETVKTIEKSLAAN